MKQRVLLVGCGEHASENLIPSLKGISLIEVAGICDNNSAALEGAAHWFPDATQIYKSELNEEDIGQYDAIVVAATPQVHQYVAWLAVSLGKPVFVEKPPTVFTHELKALAIKARQLRVTTCVG